MLHGGLFLQFDCPRCPASSPPQSDQTTQRLAVPGPGDAAVGPSLLAEAEMPPPACVIADPEKNNWMQT